MGCSANEFSNINDAVDAEKLLPPTITLNDLLEDLESKNAIPSAITSLVNN